MARIAFLGLGAMGSRMALGLARAGHHLTIWSRDPSKAAPLTAEGAEHALTPARAVAAAEFVIAMVRDDEASHAVWLDPATGALAAMPDGATAIDCSTLTAAHVARLAAAMRTRGVPFLDAPVMGSRPQADARQLIFLVGGDAGDLARAAPLLHAMSGAVHHVGPNGAGSMLKLAANALFGVQVAALAEQLAILGKSGIDPAHAMTILSQTPVIGPAAKGAAAAMIAGNVAPMFPVELAEKDLGYVQELARAAGSAVPLADATRKVMSAAIAAGFGDDNITGVARLYG